jgi:hypothetical protein
LKCNAFCSNPIYNEGKEHIKFWTCTTQAPYGRLKNNFIGN